MIPLPKLLVLAPLLVPLLPQEEAPPRAERLAAGLAEIQPGRMESDLGFLASDALGGRDTPSPGLTIAALFLRARLQRLGLAPVEGRWFHEYSLGARGLDREASALTLDPAGAATRLAFGRDYWLNRSRDLVELDLRGPVVSVGAGYRADFEAAELGGAWALLLDPGRTMRRAQRMAQEAGAIGVLAAAGPDYGGRPYAEKYASVTALLNDPQRTYGAVETEEGHDLPLVMLAPEALRALLAAAAPFEGELPRAGQALGLEVAERRVPKHEEIPVFNVCGLWPGNHPELGREVIVVSAHYDHVGTQGEDIYNGADDNGSGTTGLLALAEALVAYGPMDRSILLLWVSGEEKGLWGSDAWTRDPLLPAGARVVADLNLDMIGRTGERELYLTPTDEHPSFNALARAAYELSVLEGFPELRSQDRDWGRSDHYNFDRRLEIPVAFLSAGEHPDYHKPTDTADKIDYAKMARIVRLVLRILDHVQDVPLERAR